MTVQDMSCRSSRKLARDLPAMLGLGIVLVVLLIARSWVAAGALSGGRRPPRISARRLKPLQRDFLFGTTISAGTSFHASSSVPAVRSPSRSPWSSVAMLIGVPLTADRRFPRRLAVPRRSLRVTRRRAGHPQLVLALALAQLMSPSLESAMLARSPLHLLAVLHPHRSMPRRRRLSSSAVRSTLPARRRRKPVAACLPAHRCQCLSPVIVRSHHWAPASPSPGRRRPGSF